MSITNNRVIQRKIDDLNTITANCQLPATAQHQLRRKQEAQYPVIHDRNVTDPLVTNSYRRATTQVGTKILFNLAPYSVIR